EYGLTVDGVMGEVTYGVLYDVYRGLIESQPDSLFVGRAWPYPGVPLAVGSEGEYVTYLQEYLNVIAEVYDGITPPQITGFFGSQTQNAVEQFQRIAGLTVSGVVRPDTWNAIASAYDDILAGESTQSGQFPGYVIS
nr:peptidoglycan-binding protein [Clostridia bacterium]